MRPYRVAFIVVVLLVFPVLCLAQGIRAELLSGPYVIAPTTDGGTVCWQTTAAVPGAVRVKADANAPWTEIKEPNSVQFHAVRLSGLADGTIHQVEVLSGARKLGELTFRTVPKKADDFTFYAYGDTRTYPAAHREVASAMLAEAQRLKQFTFVVQTGDLAEVKDASGQDRTDVKATAEQFFAPAEPVLSRMPLVSVRGNHELFTDLFKKYFPAPPRPAASAGGDDYVLDYGSLRLIVLDKYAPKPAFEARMKWLEDRLAEAQDRWRVVTMHEPLYSSGYHGSAAQTRALMEPVLVAGKAHLMLCGHDHDYERTKPIQGIVHIVTGGGGAPLYGLDKDHTGDWSAKFVKTHNFLTVSVTPEKLSVRAFMPKAGSTDFEVFDSVEIPRISDWPHAAKAGK
jgi:acid phosphatase type 7